jgi:hypothetical protein
MVDAGAVWLRCRGYTGCVLGFPGEMRCFFERDVFAIWFSFSIKIDFTHELVSDDGIFDSRIWLRLEGLVLGGFRSMCG